MEIKKKIFGTTKEGVPIYLYSILNEKGMKVQITNYGAILVALYVPDKNGNIEDVVLGYDKLEDYYINGACYGATVGPNANRIGGASFVLDGKKYQLDKNDGKNNLHSHAQLGYQKRIWKTAEEENAVTFYLEETDGETGFPGNKKVQVTYRVTEENELRIHYHVSSDKPTVINMTNHSYFNLAGQGKGKIENHMLTLYADHYTPVSADLIPTGEIASAAGTPMDFTTPKRVGEEIDADFEQLRFAGGYDHNWVLNGQPGMLRHIATVEEPVNGRRMKVFTDLPGVQFYTGNFIEKEVAKEGALYDKRYGLCLETQYYPDTPNKPHFPSDIFGPDRDYDSTTVYQFETFE